MAKFVSSLTRKRQSRANLTRKQLKFVAEYAHLENGTEAARRAGYNGSDNVLGVRTTLEGLAPDHPLRRALERLADADYACSYGPASYGILLALRRA